MNAARVDVPEFAERVLFGTSLADKLAPPVQAADVPGAPAHFVPPAFPGRPPELRRIGAAEFPSTRRLHDPAARGRILHFFANHELLAMELMALVLLRFPEAPAEFRGGLVRTIVEEQSHLRLYLARMQALGVRFGDLPLSDFFWKGMAAVRSPLEFVVQMSLTFEQANLDYSAHYRDVVAAAGDADTAAILDRVYREEIGHVKHGLLWFNRWREHPERETDWDAYTRLLPPPLSPRRAKGTGFRAAARREAGFSETYIRALDLHAGSRGRAPVVWFFNPNCEAEIARGAPGGEVPAPVQAVTDDLAPLLLFLARDADLVQVRASPRAEWLQHLAASGFRLPEFVAFDEIRAPKLSGFEPWGWSPEAMQRFRPLAERLVQRRDERSDWNRELLQRADFACTGIGRFFSKAWAADFLGGWLASHPELHPAFGTPDEVGRCMRAAEEVFTAVKGNGPLVLKAPYGSAGRELRRVAGAADLTPALRGWIRNLLETQGGIVVEPWLDKQRDLSMQMEVRSDGTVELLGAREFLADARGRYRGAILGRGFWRLAPEERRFVDAIMPAWLDLARAAGAALGAGGYRGPAGIDAMLYRTPDGALRFKPLGELNPRWTMGRVALALERHVAPDARAAWCIARREDLDAAALAASHPAHFHDAANGRRISRGIFFTTDPERAKRVVTALAVGAAALGALIRSDPDRVSGSR